MSTLFDVVRYRATAESGCADRPAFSYLNDGERISGSLTYGQLDAKARALAARLQCHTQPGDRVLLVYPPCMDYIVAFYACVYAGVVAVPTVSPNNARTLPRLRLMAVDAEPAVALTLQSILTGLPALQDGATEDDPLARLHWLATDVSGESESASWTQPATQSSDIVFLQYTSGSTGTPKGVMVSHANVLANAELSRLAYRIAEGDVFVSWLPPHHDFGLIGAMIIPVYVGGHCVQLPPATFLMRPYRWLKLITQYRARITGAPNFAYQLCVQRISDEEKQTLDLSSLEVTVNGAERIRAETLRQFAAAFASCGLKPQSMTPSYGMAESVLMASANLATQAGQTPLTRSISKAALESGLIEISRNEHDGTEVVLTGASCTVDHRVIIVDPATCTPLADEQVGEVWIQGGSVAQGYWGRPEESDRTFRAELAGHAGAWLRTGDLGFVSDGGLYITGRIKEVMIFNGRNIYPQDVEITIEALDPAFRANGCAAFTLEDGTATGLVVVQELERRRQPLLEGLQGRIRTELADRHEIFDLAAVLLVRAGNIPRTSSGKIQRGRCRQLFETGAIDAIWSWNRADEALQAESPDRPATPTEQTLLKAWQEAFGNSNIAVTDNFFLLGGHSLLAAQLIAKLRSEFQIELPLSTLFHAPTIVALAREIDAQGQTAIALPPIVHGEHAERLPLTFAQQRFWFLDQYQPNNPFYTIPLALTIGGAVNASLLQRVLDALVERHAPLRTVFQLDAGQPMQVILPKLSVPLRVIDLSDLSVEQADQQAKEEIHTEAYRPFDLANGPLMRATLLRQADAQHTLLLSLHHIIYDGGSTVPLLTELTQLYAALSAGRPTPLQPLAVDYADYTQWEAKHLGGTWLDTQLAWWRDALNGVPPLLAIPTDRPRLPGNSQRGAACALNLPSQLIQDLTALGRQHNATLFMVLTAAMNALMYRTTGQNEFCLGMMSANRPAGTEALIGNFINVVPLRSRLNGETSFPALLADTARNLLASYERQLPFELILQHVAVQRDLAYMPYVQVVLNFHSELLRDEGSLRWQDNQELQIAGRHANSVQHAAFDIKVEMQDHEGGLAVSFEYSTDLFESATIARMAEHYRTLLTALAADPQSRVRDLPLLTAAERQQVLQDWNASTSAVPSECIHTLFDAQAARTPDAIAVQCGDDTLSYAALNQRANQLAHHLRSLG
ncbi:condensation domain-containing protein, partial [Andreprevotia chitinilytica]|uniref:condensation domain-containing protein n=1 Tax=Andreprevotia chitinilytica TaxID=396808 RepID=UPI00068BD03A